MDLTGKTAIVTGANAGLGFQTATLLAQRGAHVIIACRSEARARVALEKLEKAVPDASFELAIVDLGDLDSVHRFGNFCNSHLSHLELLCNNAGVIAVPFALSPQGFESHMAINYYGPFALTGHLLGLLRATPGARIVNISSQIHRVAKLRMDDLNWSQRSYQAFCAYGQSKLALTCFTLELVRRLERHGIGVKALLAHPGFSLTDVPATGWFSRVAGRALAPLIKHSGLVQSAAEGARSSLYALSSDEAQPGDYVGPNNWLGSSGAPARAQPSPKALDLNVAAALWERSSQATGVFYLN